MTITSNNFDIYSVVNKASAKDRATIFFDELLRMAICGNQKFNDQEREAIAGSFKTNEEKNLFNLMLHRCVYSIMSISQAEKSIENGKYFETIARVAFSAMSDQCLIDDLVSNALKEIEKGKLVSDKKAARKIFDHLKKQIRQMCLLDFGDKVVKNLVDKVYNRDGEEKDANFYEEKFFQFFKDTINAKANTANEFLKIFQGFYKDFDIKFDVIDNKIKNLEIEIDSLRKFCECIV